MTGEEDHGAALTSLSAESAFAVVRMLALVVVATATVIIRLRTSLRFGLSIDNEEGSERDDSCSCWDRDWQ